MFMVIVDEDFGVENEVALVERLVKVALLVHMPLVDWMGKIQTLQHILLLHHGG